MLPLNSASVLTINSWECCIESKNSLFKQFCRTNIVKNAADSSRKRRSQPRHQRTRRYHQPNNSKGRENHKVSSSEAKAILLTNTVNQIGLCIKGRVIKRESKSGNHKNEKRLWGGHEGNLGNNL